MLRAAELWVIISIEKRRTGIMENDTEDSYEMPE